jgi:type IV secretory pathway VirB10-like protein
LSPDLSPKSDPNTQSQLHRLLKGQGMVQLGGLPQFQNIANNRAIYRYVARILTGGDASEYEMPEAPPAAPPPPPQVIAAQIRAQSQQESDNAKLTGIQMQAEAKKDEAALESADREQDRNAADVREAMKLAGQKGKDMASQAHDANQAQAQRGHEVGLAAMDQAHAQESAATDAALNQPMPPGAGP